MGRRRGPKCCCNSCEVPYGTVDANCTSNPGFDMGQRPSVTNQQFTDYLTVPWMYQNNDAPVFLGPTPASDQIISANVNGVDVFSDIWTDSGTLSLASHSVSPTRPSDVHPESGYINPNSNWVYIRVVNNCGRVGGLAVQVPCYINKDYYSYSIAGLPSTITMSYTSPLTYSTLTAYTKTTTYKWTGLNALIGSWMGLLPYCSFLPDPLNTGVTVGFEGKTVETGVFGFEARPYTDTKILTKSMTVWIENGVPASPYLDDFTGIYLWGRGSTQDTYTRYTMPSLSIDNITSSTVAFNDAYLAGGASSSSRMFIARAVNPSSYATLYAEGINCQSQSGVWQFTPPVSPPAFTGQYRYGTITGGYL